MLIPLEDVLGAASFPLPENGGFAIGRKAACQLPIPESHAYVSGEHCRLRMADGAGEAQLEDLSANGTFINGKRVGKNKIQLVRVGDEISLAKPSRRGGAMRFRLAEGCASGIGVAVKSQTGSPANAVAASSVNVQQPGLAPAAAEPIAQAQRVGGEELRAVPAPAPASKAAASVPQDQLLLLQPGGGRVQPQAAPPPAEPPGIGGGPEVPVADLSFARALLEERQQDDELLAQLRARSEEEAACAEALAVTLRTVQLEQREQQEQRQAERQALEQFCAESEVPAQASTAALASCNARLSEECEELRSRLVQMRDETAGIERACPNAEEGAVQERWACGRLQAELLAEQQCVERSELEASGLQAQVEKATGREQQLRAEVALAAARNAQLEEECAAAAAESRRAWTSAQVARQRLDSHSSSLTSLRGVVQDHARRVRERLSVLEQVLFQVQDVPQCSLTTNSDLAKDHMGNSRAPAGGRRVSACKEGGANGVADPHVASSADDYMPTLNVERVGAGIAAAAAAAASFQTQSKGGVAGMEQPLAKRFRSWGRGQACADLDECLPGLAC